MLVVSACLLCLALPAVAFAADIPADGANGGGGLQAGTLQAQADTYTVTLDANGGTFDNGESTMKLEASTVDDLGFNDPSRSGYVFASFWTKKSGGKELWDLTLSKDITVYAHWNKIVNVSTYAELKKNYANGKRLNSLTGKGVRITKNLTVTGSITNNGEIYIPKGVTVTIAKGGCLEGAIQNKGTIIVKSGGSVKTTMGGDIANYGTISVAKGGAITSQMGGKVVNEKSGTLKLAGTFNCGCFRGVWFKNTGKVTGSGKAIIQCLDDSSKSKMVKSLKKQLNNSKISITFTKVGRG